MSSAEEIQPLVNSQHKPDCRAELNSRSTCGHEALAKPEVFHLKANLQMTCESENPSGTQRTVASQKSFINELHFSPQVETTLKQRSETKMKFVKEFSLTNKLFKWKIRPC